MTPRQRLILAVIGIAGLLLRFGWVIYIDPEAGNDADAYRNLAMQFASGEVYGGEDNASWRPPGYAMAISLAYRLGMETEWGCRTVDILASFLLSLILAAIVRVQAGPWAGYWAFIFFMLNPLIVAHGAVSMSQSVAAPAFYLGVLACFSIEKAKRPGWRLALALVAGLALGYATLVRAETLVSFPFFALYLLYRLRGPGLPACALLLIGGMAAILPWSIRNSKYNEKFVLVSTNGGAVFFGANHVTDPEDGGEYNQDNYVYLMERASTPVEINSLGFKLGIEYILDHPGLIARSMPGRWDKYLEGFRYLDGAGFLEPRRDPAKFFDRLFRIVYYLTALLPFLFVRRIWRALRKGDGRVYLFLSLYAVYLAILPFFEIKNINHYPFFWLLVLLFFLFLDTTREASDEASPEESAA